MHGWCGEWLISGLGSYIRLVPPVPAPGLLEIISPAQDPADWYGQIFNAGFMILLAQWGAVVTSVGNLFTLILVAAADEFIALTNGYSALSVSTLAGSGFILASFALLMTGS
jgi:hypothetical protein